MSYYDDIFDDLDMYLNEDYEFDNELEILNEKVIYKYFKELCIVIDNDRGNRLKTEPYFKLYNASDVTKATKVARISFEDFHYIIHEDRYYHWDLTNSEKDELTKIVQKDGKNGTVWNDMIYTASEFCEMTYKEFIKRFNITKYPDFRNIYYRRGDWNKAKSKGIER